MPFVTGRSAATWRCPSPPSPAPGPPELQFIARLAGLIAGFVAVWPALYLVLVHANLSSFYQENIGYHFFWVLRLVDGAPSDVVIPQQGVLFSLIQAIFYLIGKALGLDLYGMIDLFALLTLAVPAVAMNSNSQSLRLIVDEARRPEMSSALPPCRGVSAGRFESHPDEVLHSL